MVFFLSKYIHGAALLFVCISHAVNHSDVFNYACILENGKTVSHKFATANRKGFLHVAQTGGSIQLHDGTRLDSGDGAYIDAGVETISITGISNKPAEFLLWDLENK